MSRYLNLADRFGITRAEGEPIGRVNPDNLKLPREDVAVLQELGRKKQSMRPGR